MQGSRNDTHRAEAAGSPVVSSQLPLVGRQRELSLLAAGLDAALSGSGCLFLASGEPGVGKTRLLEELDGLAAERGVTAVWGRCWEGSDAPPFWPWAQVLRSLSSGSAAAAAANTDALAAAQVARLVPGFGERLGLAPAPLLSTDEAETVLKGGTGVGRVELLEGVAAFLRAVADELGGLVLLLDDLHAARLPAILLLEFLVRDLRSTRILVLAAHREAEARAGTALAERLTALDRDSMAIPLRGLDASATRDLVANLAGREPSDGLVATLLERTGGNPFFVDEAVRLLLTDDSFDAPPAANDRTHLPERVRSAIRARLMPLPAASRDALRVAAVVGQEFDLDLLSNALSAEPATIAASIEVAYAGGLVRRSEQGLTRFSHALVREAIYGDLTAVERVRLHARVGSALEARHGNRLESVFPALAHHFLQGLPEAGAAKALRYVRCAGERALELCAYEDAAAYFEQALALLDREQSADARERAEVLLCLARAATRGGDTDRARRAIADAAAEARRLGSATLLAESALAFRPEVHAIPDPERVGLLEEALAALGEDDCPLRARVLAQLACELYNTGDVARRDALSRVALAVARRVGDRATLAFAVASRCFALWGQRCEVERLPLAEELLGLARGLGEWELAIEAHHWRFIDSLSLGDLDTADREMAAANQLAEKLRQPYYLWWSALWRAMRAALAGRLADGKRLASEAYTIGAPVQPQSAASVLNGQLWVLLWFEGNLEPLGPMIETFFNQNQTVYPETRVALVSVLAATDRLEEARREFETLAAADFAVAPRTGGRLACLAVLAETCAVLGDIRRAERLYEMISAHSGRVVLLGAAVNFGPVDRYLGLLAQTLELWETAEQHFAESLALARRLASPPYVAFTQLNLGAMLVERGRGEDRARARIALEEALTTARAIGMQSVVATAQKRLAELGATPESPATQAARRPANGNIFRREADLYWTLAYDGIQCRLKDLKGLGYLAQLIRQPGHELHALDLVSHEVALAGDDDTGKILDTAAKAEIRQRLEDLHERLREAESFNDQGGATRARTEIERLSERLASAMGLGGRDRAVGPQAERARLLVTQRIKTALRKIRDLHPPLARHLANAVKTGYFCSYAPHESIDWRLDDASGSRRS